MLMQKVTPQMVEEWKAVWNKYKDRLRPNRKSGAEVADYLTGRYLLKELHDDKAIQAVTDNVLYTSHLRINCLRGQRHR